MRGNEEGGHGVGWDTVSVIGAVEDVVGGRAVADDGGEVAWGVADTEGSS
jgi:hypothetical protein